MNSLKWHKAIGWGLRRIKKGAFLAEAVQTQLAGVLLSAAHYGRAVIQVGEPPPGKVTFAMLMSGAPARWQGREFGLNDLLAGTHRVEMEMVCKAGYVCATASFPLDLVDETSDRCGYPRIADARTSTMVGLEYNKAGTLRHALETAFIEAITHPFNDLAATWARKKQEDLLYDMLACLSNGASKVKSVSHGERARVLMALAFAIKDQPEDVLSVGDLVESGASERTLDTPLEGAFRLIAGSVHEGTATEWCPKRLVSVA